MIFPRTVGVGRIRDLDDEVSGTATFCVCDCVGILIQGLTLISPRIIRVDIGVDNGVELLQSRHDAFEPVSEGICRCRDQAEDFDICNDEMEVGQGSA